MPDSTSSSSRKDRDLFAGIATSLSVGNRPGLEEPARAVVSGRTLPYHKPAAGQPPRLRAERIATAEELAQALERERQRTRAFLQNLAPPLPELRSRFPIKECQWRVETAEDRADFFSALEGQGTWKTVSIPHYEPPLGRASTLYRCIFDLPADLLHKERRVLCFEGVDYRCQPYLNGFCLGKHEGFFEPFEFDVTGIARPEENTLLVRVENDFTMLGEAFASAHVDGDKVYAATGLGYDDPEKGWHHCPPGMGICQPMYLEGRARLAITDIFVRPLSSLEAVEIHVEVENAGANPEEQIALLVSIHGQNFFAEIHRDHLYRPTARPEPGFGDLEKKMPDSSPLLLGPGRNFLSLTLPISDARLWELDAPWLYQAQIRLVDGQGSVLDTARRQFGMRRFVQDENSTPKGKFYFNGREIRLRGANTMGHLDQCVFREDWDQLRDDILLAKLTNLNFLRLTQHPVQKEVYDYCDRLGLFLQTDLPLFGSIRRHQFLECVRQASAMERLVRSHPSSVLISFINEPFPAARAKPHRFMSREDMELFFDMASKAVRRENPDRVIKCVDGDYDPPARSGMPDNHCYCGWYIGHGIDLGRLHHGHWMPVKSGWHFGCGEFGSEGLDSEGVMREFYPKSWLPEAPDVPWNPGGIPQAQTMDFHLLWYPTPGTVAEWIEASQRHQEWITRLMTEAFRRLPGMNTFAIHLFIDAWPAGWMKAIMDTKRVPKRAWFAYRDALQPVALSLRCDRTSGFAGETLPVEVWIANDRDEVPFSCTLDYELCHEGVSLARGSSEAVAARCAAASQGVIEVSLPEIPARGTVRVGVTLLDSSGRPLHDTHLELDVFPRVAVEARDIFIVGDIESVADLLANLNLRAQGTALERASLILITDISHYLERANEVNRAVRSGATSVFMPLPPGLHRIGASDVQVRQAGMGPRHFVSCSTGHPMVADFHPQDFKFWFDESRGCVTPILTTVLEADSWTPILISGDGGWQRPWGPVPVAAEYPDGKGCWRICQVQLGHRLKTNPVAHSFAQRLLASAGLVEKA